jgi:hypothetical protein
MMGVVVGAYVPLTITTMLTCDPPAASWDLSLAPTAKCINKPVFYIASGAINVGTDLVLLLLPWPMVWNLQLPRRQKLGLALIFLTGSLYVDFLPQHILTRSRGIKVPPLTPIIP